MGNKQDERITRFLTLLAGEKVYADFSEIPGNTPNPMHFGIYDVRETKGADAFMIDYKQVKTSIDTIVTTIELRVPSLDIDVLVFNRHQPNEPVNPDFIALHNFINRMQSRPVQTSYNEAADKFYFFMTSSDWRANAAKKYLNARIVYDVINQMILAGPQHTKCTKVTNRVPGGYRVTVRFPGGKTETVMFYDAYTRSDKECDGVQIVIPSIQLEDTFNNHADYKNKMVYNHARAYLNALTKSKPIEPGREEFNRFDAEYRSLMKRVLHARELAKTK